jgi:hypothetical protein
MERVFVTDDASEWLRERGVSRSPADLRKLRVVGGGPRFRLLNRRPVYTEADLADWVQTRLSPPFRNTAEAHAAGAAD